MVILTPAYGKDYKNKKDAEQAFLDGKDWVLNDITSPYNGKYCSIRDLSGSVELRYGKLRKMVIVKIKK